MKNRLERRPEGHTAAAPYRSYGLKTLAVVAIIAGLATRAPGAEDGSKSSPGAAPTWKRMVRLADGRTFVTYGSLSIEAAVAKPAVLPKDELAPASGSIIQRYLTASLPNEFRLADLAAGPRPRTYRAPTGVVLNADYVDYLRRTLPEAKLRFRMKGDLDPVVILSDDTAIGLVMPMAR